MKKKSGKYRLFEIREVFSVGPSKRGGEGGSGAQKHSPVSLPDAVGAKKKTSTPSTSDRSTKKKLPTST